MLEVSKYFIEDTIYITVASITKWFVTTSQVY